MKEKKSFCKNTKKMNLFCLGEKSENRGDILDHSHKKCIVTYFGLRKFFQLSDSQTCDLGLRKFSRFGT